MDSNIIFRGRALRIAVGITVLALILLAGGAGAASAQESTGEPTAMTYKGEYNIRANTVDWFFVGLGGYWKGSVRAVIPFEITLRKQQWGKKFEGETKVKVNWDGEWGEKDTLVKKTSVTGTLAGTGDVIIKGEFDPDNPETVLIRLEEGNFFSHTYVQDPKPLNKDSLGYYLNDFVKPGGMFYGPLFDEQVAFWDATTSKKVLGKFKRTGSSVTVSRSGKELGLMAGNYLKGGQYTITATLNPVSSSSTPLPTTIAATPTLTPTTTVPPTTVPPTTVPPTTVPPTTVPPTTVPPTTVPPTTVPPTTVPPTTVPPTTVPQTPDIPSGPASGYSGLNYTYSASASDIFQYPVQVLYQVPYQVSYRCGWFGWKTCYRTEYRTENRTEYRTGSHRVKLIFDWGDESQTTTQLTASGNTLSESHKWINPGTYDVKVQAKDEYGNPSSWSKSKIVFITDSTPPTATPTLTPTTVPPTTVPPTTVIPTTVPTTSNPPIIASMTKEYKDLREKFETALKRFREAEDRLKVAEEQYISETEAIPRNEDRQAKKAELWRKFREVVIEFHNRRIDLLIADIQLLKYDAKFTGISETLPFDASSTLDKHILELENIRTKVQQATEKDMRKIDRDLKNIKEKFELEKRYFKGIRINNQMDTFFARTDAASVRMNELIKKLNENGKDTSKLTGILSDFNNLMNQAKENHKKTLELFRSHSGFDSAGMVTDIRNAEDFIRQINEQQKDTERLRSAIAELREFFGEAKRLIQSTQDSTAPVT